MEIPPHWRLKAQRYRFEGATCSNCGRLSFPPRPVCLDCAHQSARIAGWELPEAIAAIHCRDRESCMTREISESLIR